MKLIVNNNYSCWRHIFSFTGLDSFMALNVVQTLKNMAHAGKTVICTIHQPSSELFAMFDKLLLMAEGRIAFLGTPEAADIFFKE